MRSLALTLLLSLMVGSAASASPLPEPMRTAVDSYAAAYAQDSGWEYIDRLSTAHGDYRRAYFTLVFGRDLPTSVCDAGHEHCWPGPPLAFQWNVEARAARCGTGWYVISTPLDRNTCEPQGWSWEGIKLLPSRGHATP